MENELNVITEKAQSKTYAELFSDDSEYYNKLFEKEGFLFLIYEKDTLKFWTDNTVAFGNDLKNLPGSKVIRLKNGWYEAFRSEVVPGNKKTIVGLLLLKREYSIQNEYLDNSFNKNFSIGSDVKILSSKSAGTYDISNYKDQYLFSIEFTNEQYSNSSTLIIKILLNVTGIIFILLFLQQLYLSASTYTGTYWGSLIFIFVIAVLRYLDIKYRLPEVFYESFLFSPQLYGDASLVWLASLGDFFINALLITYIANHIRQNWSFHKTILQPVFLKQTIVLGLLLLLFFISRIVNYLISGLVVNSSISFNVNDVFSLNVYSYIAFVSVALLLLSFYFLADKTIDYINRLQLKSLQLAVIFIVCITSIILVFHFRDELDDVLLLWSSVLLLSIYLVKRFIYSQYTFTGVIILLMILSFYCAHLFLKFSEFKENNSRLVLAEKFSAEQDPVAEHLFDETLSKIQADTTIEKNLNKNDSLTSKITEKLIQRYFNGYWKKYDIKISLLHSGGNPFDNSQTIVKNASPTQSENLYYVDDNSGIIKFAGYIPIEIPNYGSHSLFVEFNPKSFSEKIGFPELLTDKGNNAFRQLKNYSFAKYKNNKLVSFYGNFSYPSVNNPLANSKSNYLFFEDEEYSHLAYKSSGNSFIVLSKKIAPPLDALTTFSFLFSFNSLLLLLTLFIYHLLLKSRFLILTFKNRIQYFLISIIFICTLLFSGASIWYINHNYEDVDKKSIREKIFAATEEIEKEDFLSGNTEYILQTLSDLFATDINIYDSNGNLIASSIPKLFEKGFLSEKMCPEAYSQLSVHQKNEFTHNEKIGKLNYLSSYTSIRQEKGELFGYLNMPYFSRQSILEQEIASFVSAIVNIYVLLFLLSAMIAVFISGYITRPLSTIQEKMGKIKLGKANEPIEWNNDDEIGSLVTEYNRMIQELAQSAELLARSERESAWREMAKQVAHEIKNPLTPMKLHIQHFQKTWKEHGPGMDKKIEQFTEMLIEQIETLSSIASEFSNYAKMPKATNEKVNIQHIIQNAIDLHKNSSNTAISFTSYTNEDTFVSADKEQLIRVFNNLIKNSIQAIPNDQKGEIEILLKKQNNQFIIQVKDNGSGIRKDQTDKIFTPNFTTKTGGTGLGLAMTKNIIESFNGKIWFETIEGTGTSFFISLPTF